MTAAFPSTSTMFRDALHSVRAFPLPVPEPAPLFSLPPTRLAGTRAEAGQPTGPPDDAWATRDAILHRSTSVAEVVARCKQRIAAHSARLGAFEIISDVDAEAALLEHEAYRGRALGDLHGVPISVKDVIDVAGLPTTGSSAALPARFPSADATAVARLRAAGALIMGKTMTHEFALGVTSPASRNPWDETRVPGGSSGGSAISILTGMAFASLATDTRASVRIPAALTGGVGLCPSPGLVPRDGWITLSWSMDDLAPMAKSVRDIALLMDVLTGGGTTFRSGLPADAKGLRLAYADPFLDGAAPGVRDVFQRGLDVAAQAGAAIVRSSAPTANELALANAVGMVISRAEARQYHVESGTDTGRCTPEVREQLEEAAHVTAADYIRALRLRAWLYERLTAPFDETDFLIMPTSKVVAPPRAQADGYLLLLSENAVPWSLVGLPAISIYAGQAEGLPVGLEIVGRQGEDSRLLGAAYALERVLPPMPAWAP
ncbi:MAG TPA: amidase [Dehalococcoidia bacterium]|nr:amidase [Dehalococcoidia bacterium]